MKKLKIILLFSLFIIIIIRFSYFNSNYSKGYQTVTGIITEINHNSTYTNVIIKAKENIMLYIYDDFNYKYGDIIKISGKFELPNNQFFIGGFDYQKYLKSKNVFYIIKKPKIELVSSNKNFIFSIKNEIITKIKNYKSYSYINALVLGNNKVIDSGVKESYNFNGVSHLFCISGMHITILTLSLFFILSKFLNKNISYIIIIGFLIFYMFLTGFSPSIIRASLMFIILTMFKMFKIKNDVIFILIIICSINLIYNPFQIYNVGFLFSYIVTFFIIKFRIDGNFFTKLFKISFLSFISGIPIMIHNFNYINILSPFINLLFVPFVSYVILPLSFFSILLPLDNINYFFISILEKLSLIFSSFKIGMLIFRKIFVLSIIYYIIIYYSIKKKNYFLFLIVLIIHYNINNFDNNFSYTMLDVNQGDSSLIILPYNKGNILIDTGGCQNFECGYAKNRIIPYLKMKGIKKIDYLILTHGDADHAGEAIYLINNFNIKHVIFNIGKNNLLEKEIKNLLSNKQINYTTSSNDIKIDTYKIKFLNTKKNNNENEDSSVIYFKYNNYKFLFMADAGKKREKAILEKYDLKKIDFLKVGHHGSNTSSSIDFITKIKPKNCLISAGKNNIYGHPNKQTLKKLNNCNIYRTDINKSIEIKIKKNNYIIKKTY